MSRSSPSSGAGLLVAALVLLLGLPGCQRPLQPGDFVQPEEPLSFSQQKEIILQAAPMGTGNDVAEAKLAAAGIEGEFSAGKTRFYVEALRRSDKTRWPLEVDLLFDENGKLFDVQPRGEFVTGVQPADGDPQAAEPPSETSPRAAHQRNPANPFLARPE